MSKVYDTGLQKYWDYKIRVCGKNSVPLKDKCLIPQCILNVNFQTLITPSCLKISKISDKLMKDEIGTFDNLTLMQQIETFLKMF